MVGVPGILARIFGIRKGGRGGGGWGGEGNRKYSFAVLLGQKIQCTVLQGRKNTDLQFDQDPEKSCIKNRKPTAQRPLIGTGQIRHGWIEDGIVLPNAMRHEVSGLLDYAKRRWLLLRWLLKTGRLIWPFEGH